MSISPLRVSEAVVIAALIAARVGAAQAASGDLDPTFGSRGKVTTDFAGFFDQAHAVVVQPDGKIVATGFTDGPVLDFALVRYNANGSLDPSFGSGGKVMTEFAGDLAFANAVAIQPDGKIVAAGGTFFAGDFALARYNGDGSLDTGFGSGGTVTTDFGSFESIAAIAVQPDDKIVAVGVSGPHFVLARYNSDGSQDSGFGAGGKIFIIFATLPFLSPDSAGDGLAMAVQADSKIVVAGTALTGTDFTDLSFDFALARVNLDGSLDSSFGTGGKVTTSFGPGLDDHATAVALQPDGKIVAAGDAFPQGGSLTGPDFALIRYNADGSVDTDFGSDGMVTTDFDLSDDRAFGLVLQADGKLVAAGSTGVFGFPTFNKDFALARYNADGSVDTAFGSGGKVQTDFDGGEDESHGVALQPDGKIVAAGFTSFALTGGDENFALARYLEGDIARMTITIDIKPGSDLSSIRVGGRDLVPVAILSTVDFDARAVDFSTVCFGDAEAASERDCTEAHGKGHVQDVDGDGRPDLVLHYETRETGIDARDTSACLDGATFVGTAIEGCDAVRALLLDLDTPM